MKITTFGISNIEIPLSQTAIMLHASHSAGKTPEKGWQYGPSLKPGQPVEGINYWFGALIIHTGNIVIFHDLTHIVAYTCIYRIRYDIAENLSRAELNAMGYPSLQAYLAKGKYSAGYFTEFAHLAPEAIEQIDLDALGIPLIKHCAPTPEPKNGGLI